MRDEEIIKYYKKQSREDKANIRYHEGRLKAKILKCKQGKGTVKDFYQIVEESVETIYYAGKTAEEDWRA